MAFGFEHPLDDRRKKLLGEIHHVSKLGKRHFRLHHPKLHEMTASLRFLRPERGPKTIHFPKRRGCCLAVELAALREISRLIKIWSLKQCGRALARVWREDRCVDQDESVVVKKRSRGTNDFMPDPKNGMLTSHPKPRVPVLNKKSASVLLGLNRKGIRNLHRLQLCDIHLVPAGRAGVSS